jgi:hypothetical protein
VLSIDVDTGDLLKWARYFENIPRRTKPALARALNAAGANIVRETARVIAGNSGLDADAILHLIIVKEAAPNDLVWEMDASAIAPPSQDWSHPWDRTEDTTFDGQTLVKIITMDDDVVCKICEDAAENGPYTLEEAKRMFAHGEAGKEGLHPRCRCIMGPWSSTRRMNVTFGTSQEPIMSSFQQMGQKVAEEFAAVLRIGDI